MSNEPNSTRRQARDLQHTKCSALSRVVECCTVIKARLPRRDCTAYAMTRKSVPQLPVSLRIDLIWFSTAATLASIEAWAALLAAAVLPAPRAVFLVHKLKVISAAASRRTKSQLTG